MRFLAILTTAVHRKNARKIQQCHIGPRISLPGQNILGIGCAFAHRLVVPKDYEFSAAATLKVPTPKESAMDEPTCLRVVK
jgi:hypothetical protein